MKNCNDNIGSDQSFLSLMRKLLWLSKTSFCNEVDFFCRLLHSYHVVNSSIEDYEWTTAQSTVSQTINGRRPFPRHMLVYYSGTRGGARLRKDVAHFLDEIIITPGIRDEFQSVLLSLAEKAEDLCEKSRAYILDIGDLDYELTELLYRMLQVLMYEFRFQKTQCYSVYRQRQ